MSFSFTETSLSNWRRFEAPWVAARWREALPTVSVVEVVVVACAFDELDAPCADAAGLGASFINCKNSGRVGGAGGGASRISDKKSGLCWVGGGGGGALCISCEKSIVDCGCGFGWAGGAACIKCEKFIDACCCVCCCWGGCFIRDKKSGALGAALGSFWPWKACFSFVVFFVVVVVVMLVAVLVAVCAGRLGVTWADCICWFQLLVT